MPPLHVYLEYRNHIMRDGLVSNHHHRTAVATSSAAGTWVSINKVHPGGEPMHACVHEVLEVKTDGVRGLCNVK